MVRSRRQFSQRCASRDRALYARRSGSHQLRSDDRGSEGVHAPVEDDHDPQPPQREEFPVARVRVLFVLRDTQEFPMPGPLFRSIALTALAAALTFIPSAPVAGQASKNRPVIAGCPSVSAKFHPCALAKAKEFSPTRMPDGTPNLQGIWDAPLAMGFQNIEDFPGDPAPGGFGP